MGGAMAYHSGIAAEDQVADLYRKAGLSIEKRRWRGRYGGEIDLIAKDGDTVVFVEVKRGRSNEAAVERLSGRQLRRIAASAEEYVARAGAASVESMRFDVALVDCLGRIRILENACAFD